MRKITLLLLTLSLFTFACQQGQSDGEIATDENKTSIASNTAASGETTGANNATTVKAVNTSASSSVEEATTDSVKANEQKGEEIRKNIANGKAAGLERKPMIDADSAARLRDVIKKAREEAKSKNPNVQSVAKSKRPYSEKTITAHTKLLSVWNCKCKQLESSGKTDEATKCRNNHEDKFKAFESEYGEANLKDKFTERYKKAVDQKCP